jgi:hypothetical protein
MSPAADNEFSDTGLMTADVFNAITARAITRRRTGSAEPDREARGQADEHDTTARCVLPKRHVSNHKRYH